MKFSIISYISIRAIARRFRKEESIENPRVMVRFPKTLHAKAKAARIDGCKQDRYYADSVSISLKRSRGHGGGNPYLGSARSNQSCSRATNCRLLIHIGIDFSPTIICIALHLSTMIGRKRKIFWVVETDYNTRRRPSPYFPGIRTCSFWWLAPSRIAGKGRIMRPSISVCRKV